MGKKLTRMEKRAKFIPDYGVDWTCNIPTICLEWRASLNGSVDALTPKQNVAVRKFLQCCLDTWEPTVGCCKNFDDVIYMLIIVTLEESKKYLKGKNGQQK